MKPLSTIRGDIMRALRDSEFGSDSGRRRKVKRFALQAAVLETLETRLLMSSNPNGTIDFGNINTVRGWAYDADGPTSRLTVTMYLNSSATTTTSVANINRPDLTTLPDTFHGYDFEASSAPALAQIQPNTSATINVLATNVGGGSNEFLGTPPNYGLATTINANNTLTVTNHAPAGSVDLATANSISGWAYDPDTGPNELVPDGTGAIKVDLSIDGSFVEQMTANAFRSDLASQPYGGNHGFTFDISALHLSTGTHTWSVAFEDSTALTSGSPTKWTSYGGTLGSSGTLAPVVKSISLGSANPSNASSVNFTVQFDESVSGVDTGDFHLSSGSVSGTSISSVTGSGSNYTVTVSTTAGTTGTLGLNLVDNSTIVGATSGLHLGGGAGGFGGFTGTAFYTIDRVSPIISLTSPSSSAYVATTTPTISGTAGIVSGDGGTVTIKVYSGFTATGTPAQTFSASVNPSTGAYSATVPSSLGQGTYTVQTTQTDAAGNTGTSSAVTFTVDTVPPAVTLMGIVGSPSSTNLSTVNYVLTFNDAVTGVDTSDFSLSTTGLTGASILSVSGSGIYTVSVNTGSGNGSLVLNLIDNDSIIDRAGNKLGGTGTGNGNYSSSNLTIDKSSPTVLSMVRAAADLTNATISYGVTFSESVTGVDVSDFSLTTTGASNATVTSVMGSGAKYTVVVNPGSIAGTTGTIVLNLVDDDSIEDAALNPLGGAGTGNGNSSSVTFTIDKIYSTPGGDPVTGSFSNTAIWLQNSGTTVTIDSAVTLSDSLVIIASGTAVDWIAGNVSLTDSQIDIQSGGALNFSSSGNLTASSNALINDGTINWNTGNLQPLAGLDNRGIVNFNHTVDLSGLTLTGGTYAVTTGIGAATSGSGYGAIINDSINGPFTVSNATLEIDSGGALAWFGGDFDLTDGATIQDYGFVILGNRNGTVNLGNTSLQVESGGVLNWYDGDIDGTGSILNYGTIKMGTDCSYEVTGGTFTNYNQIDWETTNFSLLNTIDNTHGGWITFKGPTKLSGITLNGQYRFDSTPTYSFNLLSAAWDLSGATFESGGTYEIVNGYATIESNVTLNNATLQVGANATLAWTAGTITGGGNICNNGTINFANSTVYSSDIGSVTYSNGTILNNGTSTLDYLSSLLKDETVSTTFNNSAVIQAMINAAPANGTITLPSGEFALYSSIDMYGTGVTLQGQGNSTILDVNHNNAGPDDGAGGDALNLNPIMDMAMSMVKEVVGDTITFFGIVDISAGDILFLNNGRGSTINTENAGGGSVGNSVSNGTINLEYQERAPQEIVHVLSVSTDGSGNTVVTLTESVIGTSDYCNISPDGTPNQQYVNVRKVTAAADGITIKNIDIHFTDGVADAAIGVRYTSNLTIDHVTIDNRPGSNFGGIGVTGSQDMTIENIYSPFSSIALNSTRNSLITNNYCTSVSLEEACTWNIISNNTLLAAGDGFRSNDLACANNSLINNIMQQGVSGVSPIEMVEGSDFTVRGNVFVYNPGSSTDPQQTFYVEKAGGTSNVVENNAFPTSVPSYTNVTESNNSSGQNWVMVYSSTGAASPSTQSGDITFTPTTGTVTVRQIASPGPMLEISDGNITEFVAEYGINGLGATISLINSLTIACGANDVTITVDLSGGNITLPGGLIPDGTGNISLIISAGSFTFTNDAGSDAANLSIEASNNACVTFNAAQTLAELTVDAGAVVVVDDPLTLAGSFDNAGTVDWKTTDQQLIAISNSGLIKIDCDADLSGLTFSSGIYEVMPGNSPTITTTLDVNGAALNIDSGASIDGSGTLHVHAGGGTILYVSGSLNANLLNDGMVRLEDSGATLGGSSIVNNGTLDIFGESGVNWIDNNGTVALLNGDAGVLTQTSGNVYIGANTTIDGISIGDLNIEVASGITLGFSDDVWIEQDTTITLDSSATLSWGSYAYIDAPLTIDSDSGALVFGAGAHAEISSSGSLWLGNGTVAGTLTIEYD